jgi:hypothetical protein
MKFLFKGIREPKRHKIDVKLSKIRSKLTTLEYIQLRESIRQELINTNKIK